MSHTLIPPTEQEDKSITKAALSDQENLPLTDAELLKMHPLKTRGIQKAPTKIPISIRLTPDVVDFFKSQGKGWQTKIDTVLSDYAHSHSHL
jgi:uncharacterized protein (DUF4415 family)